SRKLYPNVDFYSGVIYSAIGIPRSMFTVMFAIARTVGWVAHWQEMIADPGMRIGRPRQLYTGATRRDYVELKTRKYRPGPREALPRLFPEQRRHLEGVRAAHRPPVDRAHRRLADAIGRKHRRLDGKVVDREAHSRERPHPLRVELHAPLGHLVG